MRGGAGLVISGWPEGAKVETGTGVGLGVAPVVGRAQGLAAATGAAGAAGANVGAAGAGAEAAIGAATDHLFLGMAGFSIVVFAILFMAPRRFPEHEPAGGERRPAEAAAARS